MKVRQEDGRFSRSFIAQTYVYEALHCALNYDPEEDESKNQQSALWRKFIDALENYVEVRKKEDDK